MKWLNNQKGMALASVLLVLAVGSILVVGMIAVSVSENRQAGYQTSSMKAYYIARAGADSMVRRLITMDKDYWNDFDTQQETDPTDFGGGSVAVSVHRTGDDFAVAATGTYRGIERDVKAVLKYNPNSSLDYAIYSKDPMVNLQMKNCVGSIGSGGTIDFKTPSYESQFSDQAQENVVFNPEFTDYSFAGVQADLTTDTTGGKPTISTDSTLFSAKVKSSDWVVDTTNADFDKQEDSDHAITMVQDTSSDPWMILWLTKDSVINGDLDVTGDHNLLIVVEESLTINGSILLSGTGNVEIHVIDGSDAADDLVMDSPHVSVGDPNDVGRVVTYLTDGSQMDLSINGTYYGCVIGPEATVSMKNGNTEFYGSLYSRVVTISANPSIYYTLPDDPSTIRLETIQFAYWE